MSDIKFNGSFSGLTVKYTSDLPSMGSNPVRERTLLWIEDIPPDAKEKLYQTIKYISNESKR